MSIILLVGVLYFVMVTSTRLLLWKKKTLRDNTPRNEVDEPTEFMSESAPHNVVTMVSKETKQHVSAVIRRAQQTGKWIEAAIYLEEKYDGASLQYARKRVHAAFRAEKGGASPSKRAVNGDSDRHADEAGDSDDSFE
jgi:hypothetical protein